MTSALTVAIYMVAGTIVAEADNTKASREAVAEVIACRMKESGRTSIDIILQRNQFCCWNRGTVPMMKRIERWERINSPAWREAKEMAGRIVHGVYPVRENAFNHFYKPGILCKPAWAGELKHASKIGTQYFGRLEKWRKQ